MDRRQHLLRAQAADVPQAVLEHPLLGRNLGRRLEMLHRATAAHPEMLAARLDPGDRTGNHIDEVREFVTGLFPEAGVLYNFSRQSTVDEDRLAIQAGNASGFMIQ